LLSAQVILKPAGGGKADVPIVSSNVHQTLPSGDAIRLVQKAFADAGFDVGAAFANSFAITAPAKVFNKVFGTRIRRDAASGDTRAIGRRGGSSYELPLTVLPSQVARLIEAVTFTPPPDFGPTSY
jgi:hypothetical protein